MIKRELEGQLVECIFTLKYDVGDQRCDPDSLVERLGVAGCTDTLVGTGEPAVSRHYRRRSGLPAGGGEDGPAGQLCGSDFFAQSSERGQPHAVTARTWPGPVA